MKNRLSASAIVLLLCCCAATAQDATTLAVVQSFPVKEHGALVAQQIRCDRDGNLYLRIVPSARYRVESQPIDNISLKGEAVASYSAQQGAESLALIDFNVTSDGHVYGIGADRKTIYLVSFDSDGKVKSKEAMDAQFVPSKFAAFPSGQFLIFGTQVGTREKPINHAPFTGIFDASGKLLRQISLADDDKLTKAADQGEKNFVGESGSPANRAISWGVASTGRDGNVYVMRRTDPAQVYVISAGGAAVRTLSIPAPEAGMLPESLQSTVNGLVVSFTDEKNTSVVVADPETGVARALYVSPPEVGVALACYAGGNGFVFLGHENKQLVINRVEPKR
jgi:hypothetical protein